MDVVGHCAVCNGPLIEVQVNDWQASWQHPEEIDCNWFIVFNQKARR